MTENAFSRDAYARLRRQTEIILKEKNKLKTETVGNDLLEIVHELEVHKIELDLQNEELRRAAKDLESARDEYFQLFESAPVGLVIADKADTIERVNRAALEMLQDQGRFLIGRKFSLLVYPKDLTTYLSGKRKIVESGIKDAKESLELRLHIKNGRIIHVLLELRAGLDEQNRFSRWQYAITDITRRKVAEAALEKVHHELEFRVQERTAQLEKMNEELIKEIEKRKKFEDDLKLQSKKILKEQERRKYLSKKLVEILERERQDIAMSLHDDLGQKLTKLNMELGFLIQNSSEQVLIKVEEIEKLQSTVTEIMDYVSGLAGNLRSHILENLGLVPAVKNMLNKIRKQSNFKIHLNTEGIPLQIPQEKAITAYRIVQESMTNCIRYAKANNIYIHLNGKEHFILLSIKDDGMGFDYKSIENQEHGREMLGIMIMNERVVQVGGTFYIESRVGKGTVVTAEIPIK